MKNKFKLVETEEYTLAVSDGEIKEGDYIFDNYAKINLVQQVRKCDFDSSHYRNGNWKKIIAYKPKGNAPELDLPLLPDVEDDVEKLAFEYDRNRTGTWINWDVKNGFIDGHKAATKVYSEEDLRKAIEMARVKDWQKDSNGDNFWEHSRDEIIQSLKLPKTPKWFVAEIEEECGYSTNGYYSNIVLKTTKINNKTYLVGTYLFE